MIAKSPPISTFLQAPQGCERIDYIPLVIPAPVGLGGLAYEYSSGCRR